MERLPCSRSLTLETGRHARMADGSVVATMGNTSVLVTATSKPSSTPQSFLPLTVDYRQKYAAAGRIPTNYLKRELAPSDHEILTSRVIDRSVRPIFPVGFMDETLLTCSLMAVDGFNSPDVISINAASAALAVSPIPWGGPVGAVRMGYSDDELLVNPTRRELQHSELDLVVTAGPKKTVVMLEGGCNNILLPKLQKAIKAGVKECQVVVQAIQKLAERYGKPKNSFQKPQLPLEIFEAVESLISERITEIFQDYSYDKQSRDAAITAVRRDASATLAQQFPDRSAEVESAFNEITKKIFRQLVLETGVRCDGRGCSDLRAMQCRSDVFPALHGSSVFQRGQTQVQCTVAFDSLHADSPLNPLLQATGGTKDRNFLLHYSFPSFATNELGRGGAVTRREIGHGALAEKALRPLLPTNHPMTILLSATVLESNGSSSMGTVCGGSMALYDAGVKLTAPAAGVALGLISSSDDSGNITDYKILTDLLGIEDYLGDMDFKIAGTRQGVTALQADIKLPGVPLSIIMEALLNATPARNKIIQLMNDEIKQPRESKDTWPEVMTLEVPPSRRARLVGPGGTTLRKIQAQTGVEIWWEDASHICVFAPNRLAFEEAKETLDALLEDKEPTLEFGAIYTARISELRPTGVMVQLYDDMTPVLLHNSQLDMKRVQHPSALGLEVGHSIKVKYFGRDPSSGQMRLSRRAIQAVSAVTRDLHKASSEPPSPAVASQATDAAATSDENFAASKQSESL
ncbi:hypothetical protein HAZT_HAZT000284 [Hyalella azteca]|uniref:polyribonucleotide nucleotidyltransferase n=1 Tax=Hyalella azteca TaxID=294128 RepID=A0A6A0HA54_HYAAZ|nr:hypothetical protein HAZT_HAZT000284 [Hyalella azteca]